MPPGENPHAPVSLLHVVLEGEVGSIPWDYIAA